MAGYGYGPYGSTQAFESVDYYYAPPRQHYPPFAMAPRQTTAVVKYKTPNFAEDDPILLTHKNRTLSFARPSSLTELKNLVKQHLQLKCEIAAMAIAYTSHEHGVLELADDATVRRLLAWTRLSLTIHSDVPTTTSVILCFDGEKVVVDAPTSLNARLTLGNEHFGIDTWTSGLFTLHCESPDYGYVEVTGDNFFANNINMWELEFLPVKWDDEPSTATTQDLFDNHGSYEDYED